MRRVFGAGDLKDDLLKAYDFMAHNVQPDINLINNINSKITTLDNSNNLFKEKWATDKNAYDETVKLYIDGTGYMSDNMNEMWESFRLAPDKMNSKDKDTLATEIGNKGIRITTSNAAYDTKPINDAATIDNAYALVGTLLNDCATTTTYKYPFNNKKKKAAAAAITAFKTSVDTVKELHTTYQTALQAVIELTNGTKQEYKDMITAMNTNIANYQAGADALLETAKANKTNSATKPKLVKETYEKAETDVTDEHVKMSAITTGRYAVLQGELAALEADALGDVAKIPTLLEHIRKMDAEYVNARQLLINIDAIVKNSKIINGHLDKLEQTAGEFRGKLQTPHEVATTISTRITTKYPNQTVGDLKTIFPEAIQKTMTTYDEKCAEISTACQTLNVAEVERLVKVCLALLQSVTDADLTTIKASVATLEVNAGEFLEKLQEKQVEANKLWAEIQNYSEYPKNVEDAKKVFDPIKPLVAAYPALKQEIFEKQAAVDLDAVKNYVKDCLNLRTDVNQAVSNLEAALKEFQRLRSGAELMAEPDVTELVDELPEPVFEKMIETGEISKYLKGQNVNSKIAIDKAIGKRLLRRH